MNQEQDNNTGEQASEDLSSLVAARRSKLEAHREQLDHDPFGTRVQDIVRLEDARAMFDEEHHVAASEGAEPDPRERARISGRVVQHRDMGKLVFARLRDSTDDLQVSISRDAVDPTSFKLAKQLDYGDIVVAEGPVGRTKKGEVCVWAEQLQLHCKSLAPPPEKWHGLNDPELRYRNRPVDMYTNPETLNTFMLRSRIVSHIRRFMDDRGFLEVETPMLQPMAGGAAARPFITNHNALGIPLYLRIAPELYLKRLLVGGMPRVYEINRNFRNEGIDRSHNPEFTSMEVYEAFGDSSTMMELTESLVHELAVDIHARRLELGHELPDSPPGSPRIPWGDLVIDYSRPFQVIPWVELFEQGLGFSFDQFDKARARAADEGIDTEGKLDDWLLLDKLFEKHAEDCIDPTRPTFVTGYPSAVSPLTRQDPDDPRFAQRWDLFIAGMEIGPAYTELNDPDKQREAFTQQLAGADEEEQAFRSLDEDFLHALEIGMPPAGGLGLGIDRIVMLLSSSTSIRDVILFPLLKSMGQAPAQD
ncbi:MAG: lysine--tRNA ligase [Phycisphaerae bacterium]|nr:lysine--tRNA ligase [Phycisphaerae bacterium]